MNRCRTCHFSSSHDLCVLSAIAVSHGASWQARAQQRQAGDDGSGLIGRRRVDQEENEHHRHRQMQLRNRTGRATSAAAIAVVSTRDPLRPLRRAV